MINEEIKKLDDLGEQIFEEYLECFTEKEQREFLNDLSQKERYAFQKYLCDDYVNKEIYITKQFKNNNC